MVIEHDNRQRGIESRERGLDRVEAGNPHWIEDASAAVRYIAARREFFTSDAIWKLVGSAPSERRAMGAVMRRALRDGIAERTDRTANSTRADCHCRPIRVWRSLIYKPQ